MNAFEYTAKDHVELLNILSEVEKKYPGQTFKLFPFAGSLNGLQLVEVQKPQPDDDTDPIEIFIHLPE